MRWSLCLTSAGFSTTLAAIHGFNYAAQGNNYSSFVQQFALAKSLPGTKGFSSARLYTMIQDGSDKSVISAVPAAIDTNTTLLLGLWASEDQSAFDDELSALVSAIEQYGTSGLRDLVVGVSVGSEDLYRTSSAGVAQGSGIGQEVATLVEYVQQVRSTLNGTVLEDVPVGHVDTLNAYTNSSNSAIIEAVDFLGLDTYPYFDQDSNNSISNVGDLFWQSYDRMQSIALGKPVWITETGWPVSGPNHDDAVPSISNAAQYWKEVACELQARSIDFWWYILSDHGASPSFGVIDFYENSCAYPLYSLQCKTESVCGNITNSTV